MGLGAPRWAQILWSTSNMGAYLPWAAGPIASGLAGRALWLWLGVLDAVQGVGEYLFSSSFSSFSFVLYLHWLPCVFQAHTHFIQLIPPSNPPRLRNDTPPNPHTLPRSLHADRRANTWLPNNNSRTSLGTR